VLPCWSSLQGAEAQCTGFWSEMMISRIELFRFTGKTLGWLTEMGRCLALNHNLGAPVELGAREVADLFKHPRQAGAA
jgi:hypothetical protein